MVDVAAVAVMAAVMVQRVVARRIVALSCRAGMAAMRES
jgi:hypothetical protein